MLVLGCSFVANGFVVKESNFNKTASSANVSLLMVASFVMILPSPYSKQNSINSLECDNSNDSGVTTEPCKYKENDELMVSRAAAIILLLMYKKH